ncbi:MAG: DUF4870 domain-containing protein [Verrucomicrobiota bacterium]
MNPDNSYDQSPQSDVRRSTPPPIPPALPPVLRPPGTAVAPLSNAEELNLAMLCHLLAIFTGFFGPLIVWLMKKDQSGFIDHHGREAINFQLTVLIVMVLLGATTFVLMLVLIGFVLLPVLFIIPILALVAEIIGAVAASKGEWFRYPCSIRFF